MKLRDWMSRAFGTDAWARMEGTLPGSLSKVIDQLLYNLCHESTEKYGGTVLKLRNAEHMYVGFKDKGWPKWDGRLDDAADYVDVRKSLREIQYLLEAYAFAETHGEHKPHVCKHCGSAAP